MTLFIFQFWNFEISSWFLTKQRLPKNYYQFLFWNNSVWIAPARTSSSTNGKHVLARQSYTEVESVKSFLKCRQFAFYQVFFTFFHPACNFRVYFYLLFFRPMCSYWQFFFICTTKNTVFPFLNMKSWQVVWLNSCSWNLLVDFFLQCFPENLNLQVLPLPV